MVFFQLMNKKNMSHFNWVWISNSDPYVQLSNDVKSIVNILILQMLLHFQEQNLDALKIPQNQRWGFYHRTRKPHTLQSNSMPILQRQITFKNQLK